MALKTVQEILGHRGGGASLRDCGWTLFGHSSHPHGGCPPPPRRKRRNDKG